MTTVSINEKFIMQFVVNVREYEAVQNLLRMLSIKYTSEDVTRQSLPGYPIAEGRKDVVFRIETSLKESGFIKWAISRVDK